MSNVAIKLSSRFDKKQQANTAKTSFSEFYKNPKLSTNKKIETEFESTCV